MIIGIARRVKRIVAAVSLSQ